MGIGYGRANVAVYDPKTGEHQSVLPEAYRDEPGETAAAVYRGADGGVQKKSFEYKGAGSGVFMVSTGPLGRIYGICDGDKLFVYDLKGGDYLHKAELGVGHVPDCCMGLWKDGLLYGLSVNSVFRIDPKSFEVTVLAKYDGNIRCGFAMDDHGIYFGDRATLMRFNWPGE